MRERSESPRSLVLFLLRNLLLYFLLLNSFLQLRDQLDLAFLSAALVIGVLAGLVTERLRLRFLPALAAAALLPVALRALFFLVFRLQRAIASEPVTDFLFFSFDKDFFPALVGYGAAWLFNFLALRHPRFPVIEAGLNSALLVIVFWSQAGYRLSIYPHPSIFAWILAIFVVAEFFVLLLSGSVRVGRNAAERVDRRAVLSFAWIVLPLLLVFLLFLLGRYSEGAVKAGGGLMKPTLFRFDFAPYVRLESEIRTSNDTVLLFRTEGRAERFLLRRFVLGSYDQSRGFSMEPGRGMEEAAAVVPDSPERYPDPGYRGRQNIRQEYYFLTLDPSSLIALNYPVRVAPLVNWKSSSFLRVYRVDSKTLRSSAGPERVTAAPSLPAGMLSYYTRGADDPMITDLARKITEGRVGYYARVSSIEQYLRENYLYSLKPGIAADGNQLRHFLFESKKGYCSYFAFAMALMCRSLGIPARVAVGFYVDPRAEILNFYEVKAFQAHAWVEVYFGDLGWVEFDPTSDQLAPGEDLTPYPGPDKERMAKLISEILNNQGSLAEEHVTRDGMAAAVSRIGSRLARAALFVARLWYLVLPALYALFLLAAKILPSVPALLSRSARRRVKGAYRLSLVRLAGLGLARQPSESLLEHARRIQGSRGVAMEPVTESLLKAAFSETFGDEDLGRVRAARAGLRDSVRSRVPWPRRLLGVISPAGAATRMP